MAKKKLKPGTMLYPLPAVMVSCGDLSDSNIITIAWTGIINSEPPKTYISVRKERHSHGIIESSKEFVINLTTKELAFAADHCGCRTGAKEDKFKVCGLHKLPADMVACPLIAEAPINIECKVFDIIELGSHDMFLADIVAVHADEELFDENGRILIEKAGLITYTHSNYLQVGPKSYGSFGFSVRKKKSTKARRK